MQIGDGTKMSFDGFHILLSAFMSVDRLILPVNSDVEMFGLPPHAFVVPESSTASASALHLWQSACQTLPDGPVAGVQKRTPQPARKVVDSAFTFFLECGYG